jgi:hypothetical protein
MHKPVVVLGVVLGVLSLLGAGYWSLIALAFGAFDRQGLEILILLGAGPFSLLPLSLVGRKRPVTAGLALVLSSIFCFFWHLFSIMGDGFNQLFRSFEAWVPVTLFCLPPLLTGAGFLVVGRNHAREVVRNWWSRPGVRRRCAVIGGTLASVGIVGLVAWSQSLPVWTVTVTPEGRASTFLRFDPRFSRNPVKLQAELRSTFAVLFRPTGGEVLGTSVFKGEAAEETSTWKVVRNENGLVQVLRNGQPIDRNWMSPEPALSHAARCAADEILTRASRTYPPPTR